MVCSVNRQWGVKATSGRVGIMTQQFPEHYVVFVIEPLSTLPLQLSACLLLSLCNDSADVTLAQT